MERNLDSSNIISELNVCSLHTAQKINENWVSEIIPSISLPLNLNFF